MTEDLQTALAKIIETVLAGKDFVLEQAPDVINQLLAWKFTTSLMGYLVCVAIGWTLLYFPLKSLKTKGPWKTFLNERGDDLTGMGGFHLVSCIIGPIFLAISFACLTWLQIWIAPKVFLLEYASNLVSNNV